MKRNDCSNCAFAVWEYYWFSCFISRKVYEDGDKNIPKKCPYENMTLGEIKKEMRKERENV